MGAKRLREIWRRWRSVGIVFCLLVALAAAIVLMAVARAVFAWPWWSGVLVFAGCFVGVLLCIRIWRMGVADVASYLDRRLPELEESCGLLLRPTGELGRLERLQAARVEKRLSVAVLPRPMWRRLLWGMGMVAMAVVISVFVGWVGEYVHVGPIHDYWDIRDEGPPPGVRSVAVRIAPPAYTGRVVRRQENFPLEVEEGSQLNWEVVTTGVVDTVAFIFNDTAVRVLKRQDGLRWNFSGAALHAGFYQVRVGRQLSGLYRFEVVRDEAPKIRVVRPKGYTVIDYGEPVKVPLQVELTDDYGIVGSSIFAIVSSGKGEAVKFRQQELHWDRGVSGGRNYVLGRMLDLVALGLKPGDELYFYCKARDNHGQEARSDMYIISFADTAQLMSLEGMTLPTDVKPEFFRSERQIIIETEALLKARDTIAVQAFKDKSNDLGIDQKLLRLRYGKFLGEEAEEGVRSGAGGDTTTFGAFGDATRIIDVFSDKHDNAEDATFLEPAVKAQLRATLSEMWKAELQFRVNTPREALPFCYKALRLLKDLQQQSRAFVAKAGVKLTPLNPDKRLTGELGTIAAPVQRLEREGGLPEEDVLRMALAVLEGMRVGVPPGTGDRVLLAQAERRLGREATARPGMFLAGYEGMKKMTELGGREDLIGRNRPKVTDLLAAEKAIVRLLPEVEARPAALRISADGGLKRLYFGFLK